MNNIKDNIYSHAIGKIVSFLNRLLHEDLGPTPDITLTTPFVVEIPEDYSILKY